MRHALLLLLVATTAVADPSPRQPRVTTGIAGKMTITVTAGSPKGKSSSNPLACTYEVTANNKTIKVKTNAEGEHRIELAPGTYKVDFSECTKRCQNVLPKPPDTIKLERGVWSTVNVGCMMYGK